LTAPRKPLTSVDAIPNFSPVWVSKKAVPARPSDTEAAPPGSEEMVTLAALGSTARIFSMEIGPVGEAERKLLSDHAMVCFSYINRTPVTDIDITIAAAVTPTMRWIQKSILRIA